MSNLEEFLYNLIITITDKSNQNTLTFNKILIDVVNKVYESKSKGNFVNNTLLCHNYWVYR